MSQIFGFFTPFIWMGLILIVVVLGAYRLLRMPVKLHLLANKNRRERAERAAFFRNPQAFVDGADDQMADAMRTALEEQRKTDPMIGAKLGGKELTARLIRATNQGKAVHIESLLAAVAAYAGYICQASLRAELMNDRDRPESGVFATMLGKDGKKYFFGDNLNKLVAESPTSIWSMAAGAAQHLGAKKLVDLIEIFKYVSTTIGTPQFGIPRIPAGHAISDEPLVNHAKNWQAMLPLLNQYCATPAEWPILFGYAIQDIMLQGKGIIDPNIALTIVMECAIPMSKVDLETA